MSSWVVFAAARFSGGQFLVVAVIALCLVAVIVWGVFEAEHDRVMRARERQMRHEARHVKGSE